MRRTLATSSVLLGVFAAACQWIVAIESHDVSIADAGAAADAAFDSMPPSSSPPRACDDPAKLALPQGAASGGNNEVVAVMAYATLDVKDAGTAHEGLELCPGVAGIDLDGKSTCYFDGGYRALAECAEADAVGCAWGPSCTSKEPLCDPAPDGRDNAVAVMFDRVAAALPITRPDTQRLLTTGSANWLLRVTEYNGEANDTEVIVSMFRSSGLVRNSERPRDRDAEAGAVLEDNWDRRSRREWTIDPTSYLRGAPPKGHVVDHVLYVKAHDVPAPGLDLILDEVILTGELRQTKEGYWAVARGRFSGRASPSALLHAVGRVPALAPSGARVCDVFPVDEMVRQACAFRDLGGPDRGSCTDFSFALSFVAVPAILGPRRLPSDLQRPDCEGIPDVCPP